MLETDRDLMEAACYFLHKEGVDAEPDKRDEMVNAAWDKLGGSAGTLGVDRIFGRGDSDQ